MEKRKDWILKLTAATTIVVWVLANGLDVFSMFVYTQSGNQLAFTGLLAKHHPGEFLLMYAGMRMLIALAACLMTLFAEKHWPSVGQVFWSALTAGALVTAIIAWLRMR